MKWHSLAILVKKRIDSGSAEISDVRCEIHKSLGYTRILYRLGVMLHQYPYFHKLNSSQAFHVLPWIEKKKAILYKKILERPHIDIKILIEETESAYKD